MTKKELMLDKPTFLGYTINQLNQKVEFYENPIYGDQSTVIAVINEIVIGTEFYDLGDFYKGSDYNPVLVNGEIMCYYELE